MKPVKTARSFLFVPALLPLALASSFARAENTSTTQEPMNIQASQLAEQQVRKQEVDRSTATDLRDVPKDEADGSSGATELESIVVTGSQGLKVKTNVLNQKKKDESVETDLRGLFKDEPAIGIGGGNGTSQYMYIRGMGQNSVDVKVDNGYSDSQIHYHQGRHMLDPALVKIVSVQKGAGSASAGIGQTNGAVVAKTLDAADLLKNSSNPNFGARINTGYNSNNGYNYGAILFGKAGIFDYLIAGTRTKENEYKGGKGYVNGHDGSDRVPYSALDKTGYLAKIGATVDNHRFVLSHRNEQHKGERLVREEFDIDSTRLSLARQSPAMRKMTVNHTNFEYIGTDLGFADKVEADLPPTSRTRLKLVKSVNHQENDGHEEEQIHRGTDHRLPQAGRGRHADQGAVPQWRFQ